MDGCFASVLQELPLERQITTLDYLARAMGLGGEGRDDPIGMLRKCWIIHGFTRKGYPSFV
jgi:hypothetical protein